MRLRLEQVEGRYASLSAALARKEIDDAGAAYQAGFDSDSDSSRGIDEEGQPLLSRRNMFTGRAQSTAAVNVAANDQTLGVVHRRRHN